LINDVVIEGIVVREPWKFMDDLFFRLAAFRNTDLPAKPLDSERDAGDYINVRISGGATGLIIMRRGMRLRIHGFFQSRDYKECLAEFVEKARKRSGTEITVECKDLKPEQVFIDRNSVEVVARRLIVLDKNTEQKKKQGLPRENHLELVAIYYSGIAIFQQLMATPWDNNKVIAILK